MSKTDENYARANETLRTSDMFYGCKIIATPQVPSDKYLFVDQRSKKYGKGMPVLAMDIETRKLDHNEFALSDCDTVYMSPANYDKLKKEHKALLKKSRWNIWRRIKNMFRS